MKPERLLVVVECERNAQKQLRAFESSYSFVHSIYPFWKNVKKRAELVLKNFNSFAV